MSVLRNRLFSDQHAAYDFASFAQGLVQQSCNRSPIHKRGLWLLEIDGEVHTTQQGIHHSRHIATIRKETYLK